jgi:hypothetical protein
VKITDVTVKRYANRGPSQGYAAGLPNVKWIEYFMADNPLLEFQSRLFKGPLLREETTDEGVSCSRPRAPASASSWTRPSLPLPSSRKAKAKPSPELVGGRGGPVRRGGRRR